MCFISIGLLEGAMDLDYALHVLKLPKVYDMAQLRTHYKRMALVLHPDRHTLDKDSANQLFSILTDSYKMLKVALEGGSSSSNDSDWRTLRTQADATMTLERRDERPSNRSRTHTSSAPAPAPGSKFNVNAFNDKFVDTRLGDENDRGYSGWMQRLSPEAARERQKKMQQEDRKKAAEEANDALVAHEPQALPSSTTIAHSELGVSRVQDFGKRNDGANLPYTDYKIAHMTSSCLIDPEVVRARRQFNTVEEYEHARSESSAGVMTSAEQASIERQERHASTRESNRVDAMRQRDEVVARHHAKIHQHALR